MLTEKSLRELAKRAGQSSEEIIKLHKSESDENIDFDNDGEYITNIELDQIKEKSGKQNYSEWAKIFKEKQVKDLRDLHGLSFEGKSIENFIDAYKDKILKDAGSEPEKRVAELTEDNKKLKTLLSEKEKEIEQVDEKYKNDLAKIDFETTVKFNLPEKLANGLTREDAFLLYKAKRGFQKTETGIELIDPKTNTVLKDKRLNPIAITDDLKEFVNSFGIIHDTGRGDSDKTSKKSNLDSFTKMSEAEKYFEENNTPLSERPAILAKAMKNEGFAVNE